MINILLADDHDVVRRGLREMFRGCQGWQVCGETSNGRDAVNMALKLKPEVAVIDLFMPELNGIDATRQIRRECAGTEVLILAEQNCDQLIGEALMAGAQGVVFKSDAGKDVIEAVEALSRHRPYFSGKISETLLEFYLKRVTRPEEASDISILTSREREIIQMLAEAKSNKEVAKALCISIKTVETHRSTVMRKLGINSVVHLVHYAIRNQLIQVQSARL